MSRLFFGSKNRIKCPIFILAMNIIHYLFSWLFNKGQELENRSPGIRHSDLSRGFLAALLIALLLFANLWSLFSSIQENQILGLVIPITLILSIWAYFMIGDRYKRINEQFSGYKLPIWKGILILLYITTTIVYLLLVSDFSFVEAY